MSEPVSSEPFRRLSASLKGSGLTAESAKLDAVLDGVWTTSTELIGELGTAVLAIRKGCRSLNDEQKDLIEACLREVRKAWPGFGLLPFDLPMKRTAALLVVATAIALGAIAIRHLRIPIDRGPSDRGRLGELRTALSIYYGDSGGRYPETLSELVPKYLSRVPKVSDLPDHAPSDAVVLTGELMARDTGGWLYVIDPRSKDYGSVRIDCSHKLPDGRTWSEF